ASSREVGTPALLRDRPTIGSTPGEGGARCCHHGVGGAHLAASYERRAHPLRLLDHRTVVLPRLEGEERSRRCAAPQAARRCRPTAGDARGGTAGHPCTVCCAQGLERAAARRQPQGADLEQPRPPAPAPLSHPTPP